MTSPRKRPPAVKMGDRARIARREMGLKQPQFVALLQEHLPTVQDKAYSSWETGTTPENVVEVSEALERVTGYPWTWFLRGMYTEPEGDPGDGVEAGDSPKITNWLLATARQENVTHVDFGRRREHVA